jgi:hypothetical protein
VVAGAGLVIVKLKHLMKVDPHGVGLVITLCNTITPAQKLMSNTPGSS